MAAKANSSERFIQTSNDGTVYTVLVDGDACYLVEANYRRYLLADIAAVAQKHRNGRENAASLALVDQLMMYLSSGQTAHERNKEMLSEAAIIAYDLD